MMWGNYLSTADVKMMWPPQCLSTGIHCWRSVSRRTSTATRHMFHGYQEKRSTAIARHTAPAFVSCIRYRYGEWPSIKDRVLELDCNCSSQKCPHFIEDLRRCTIKCPKPFSSDSSIEYPVTRKASTGMPRAIRSKISIHMEKACDYSFSFPSTVSPLVRLGYEGFFTCTLHVLIWCFSTIGINLTSHDKTNFKLFITCRNVSESSISHTWIAGKLTSSVLTSYSSLFKSQTLVWLLHWFSVVGNSCVTILSANVTVFRRGRPFVDCDSEARWIKDV